MKVIEMTDVQQAMNGGRFGIKAKGLQAVLATVGCAMALAQKPDSDVLVICDKHNVTTIRSMLKGAFSGKTVESSSRTIRLENGSHVTLDKTVRSTVGHRGSVIICREDDVTTFLDAALPTTTWDGDALVVIASKENAFWT